MEQIQQIERFLGHAQVWWVGLQTLATVVSASAVVTTGLLIYNQLRTSARASQLESIKHMQTLWDSFAGERDAILCSFPLELLLTSDQFATRPPDRQKRYRNSAGEQRRMHMTSEQKTALQNLTQEQRNVALVTIHRLNDIGQLVEDGFIDRRVFLGKYHVSLIRLCPFLEAIRRDEEEIQGGNFGHRLLRMRAAAIRYNTVCSKHREVDVVVRRYDERRVIQAACDGSLARRIGWWLQRKLRLY